MILKRILFTQYIVLSFLDTKNNNYFFDFVDQEYKTSIYYFLLSWSIAEEIFLQLSDSNVSYVFFRPTTIMPTIDLLTKKGWINI